MAIQGVAFGLEAGHMFIKVNDKPWLMKNGSTYHVVHSKLQEPVKFIDFTRQRIDFVGFPIPLEI